jgi:hypothetical protein
MLVWRRSVVVAVVMARRADEDYEFLVAKLAACTDLLDALAGDPDTPKICLARDLIREVER